MKITTYGTRGSTPVCRPGVSRYGGNTTCVRVVSDLLPEGTALVIDAGSGLVPASYDMVREGVRRIVFLMTHYHHDHTQGFPLAPHTFMKDVPITVIGPKEYGIGPKDMMEDIMRGPYFPVNFAKVGSHFSFVEMLNIGSEVLLIHPEGGFHRIRNDEFERLAGDELELDGIRVKVDDCLVIRMYKTEHPEYTISYRFDERSTGKVMVLLTDHENTDAIPSEMLRHINGADLLVQDAQFTREQYDSKAAGLGHGTGDYTARVMKEAGAARLGHTHHDPMADDDMVDSVVFEARQWLDDNGAPQLKGRVFACADYQEIEV